MSRRASYQSSAPDRRGDVLPVPRLFIGRNQSPSSWEVVADYQKTFEIREVVRCVYETERLMSITVDSAVYSLMDQEDEVQAWCGHRKLQVREYQR